MSASRYEELSEPRSVAAALAIGRSSGRRSRSIAATFDAFRGATARKRWTRLLMAAPRAATVLRLTDHSGLPIAAASRWRTSRNSIDIDASTASVVAIFD